MRWIRTTTGGKLPPGLGHKAFGWIISQAFFCIRLHVCIWTAVVFFVDRQQHSQNRMQSSTCSFGCAFNYGISEKQTHYSKTWDAMRCCLVSTKFASPFWCFPRNDFEPQEFRSMGIKNICYSMITNPWCGHLATSWKLLGKLIASL